MPTWIRACSTDDIDEEDVARFDHDGRTFAIYHSPDGEFFATDGLCTHEQIHLADGLVMDYIIECPKHNGRFDYRTGAAKGAPVCVNLDDLPGEGRGRRRPDRDLTPMAGMVIVGAGECGTRAALALREAGYDGPVTLIGAEPHAPYERPPLSKDAITAEAPAPKAIAGADRLAEAGIDFRPGAARATAIDRAARAGPLRRRRDARLRPAAARHRRPPAAAAAARRRRPERRDAAHARRRRPHPRRPRPRPRGSPSSAAASSASSSPPRPAGSAPRSP